MLMMFDWEKGMEGRRKKRVSDKDGWDNNKREKFMREK